MTALALTCGSLAADGFVIRRSGMHWLRGDGYVCRPNEVVGYCNISLDQVSGQRSGNFPLADEMELHVAFAPPVAGCLRIADGRSPGGYLNTLGLHVWNSDDVLAHLEKPSEGDQSAQPASVEMRLLMIAGRRMSALADTNIGILPGWHSRSRAWWCDRSGNELSTLLCMGVCDAAGVVRGNETPFVEAFEATPSAAQLVYVPDHPIVPCAPILLEQLMRSPAQNEAIAADLSRGLTNGRVAPDSNDWMFAGALLASLQNSPMRDRYDVLTPTGLQHLGPANTILMSLNSEVRSILRHKKLGYAAQMLRHRQTAAGPAVRSWLASEFEPIRRSIDDIKRDYRQLIDAVAAQTGARILILNRMSTSGFEDITSYVSFDAPMSDTLENIAAKEMNLMLHDLALECDVSIVDVDAIAAELGGSQNLPDGIHHSAAMQAMVRSEVVHILNS
ncbi:MAG: hypothetical protein J0H40_14520 [Rhizobiales bacterium]|nr:hypothetical protein [Hyphomicrobiales bacterium]